MAATTSAPAKDKIDPQVIKTALILITGAMAVIFDTTIVSVALHTLAVRLNTSVSTIQWVTTGYLLALGIVVPLSTWGLRRFGGKRVWLLGPILGPLIGGAILTHWDWRFMFWVNVPFCLLGLFLAWRFMADDKPQATAPRAGLDLPGLALLTPGTVAVLLGLANAGTSAGFGHPDVVAPLAIGVALLAAFTGYALRRAQPLVQVRLLAKRSVGSSAAVLFFTGFSLYGAMLLLPLYYQEVRGVTALTAGIMLVPQGAGAVLSRTVAGNLLDKVGPRIIAVLGFVVVAAATIPFALAGAHTNEWLLALWLVIRGFGLGAVTMPVIMAGYMGLDKQEIPHSSVLTRMAQQIGGSFGTAVLAVILASSATIHPGNLDGAFQVAFWWSAGFSAVAVLLSLWLPGKPARQPGS